MTTAPTRWARLPHRRPLGSLLAAVIACEAVGVSGSLFTAMGVSGWYPSLARPALAPPNWVFAPVWTVLFALMGGALWLAIVATVVAFDRVDRRAAALLLPYLAWVSFAAYLNYAFWTLN